MEAQRNSDDQVQGTVNGANIAFKGSTLKSTMVSACNEKRQVILVRKQQQQTLVDKRNKVGLRRSDRIIRNRIESQHYEAGGEGN